MPRLTGEQKREVCTIAAVGCDREIAARYLGCTLEELEAELRTHPRFARQLAQAEATAELSHMKNLKVAAQEEKNWRASVWWLERRAPERYGVRAAGVVPASRVKKFLEALAAIIAEEVSEQEDRDRLLERLDELARQAAGAEGGDEQGVQEKGDKEC